MALFNSDSERQRKENLKRMEDERLRFAQEMDARGFRPERMFFCSREDGSFVALALHEGKLALIDAPKFGTDGKFTLDLLDAPQVSDHFLSVHFSRSFSDICLQSMI